MIKSKLKGTVTVSTKMGIKKKDKNIPNEIEVPKVVESNTLCIQVTGLTELNKKKKFIVLAKDLTEAVKKAESYVFKGTKLKVVKSILSLEVIASTKDNDLLL